MHFSTIISLDIPEIENEDLDSNEQVEETIEDIKRKINSGDNDVMLRVMLRGYNGLTTTFAREVSLEADNKLERYIECTENPEYLEFEDMTEWLTNQYNNGKVCCVKLPNGMILPEHHYTFSRKYCVKDGKVYKRYYGPHKVNKRTKKSKRIKVYEDYPFNKLYKTLEDFAEDYYGYSYYEEKKAYGYYYNPNGKFDWYQIGGRWPELFLVKEECTDCSCGSRSWCNDDWRSKAPKGYKWVCAARIRDIEWKVMYDWKFEKYSDTYEKLKSWFEDGMLPDDDNHYVISEKGISSYCTMVYKNGQSFDDFLKERDFVIGMKYPLHIYSFLDDSEGWIDCEYVSHSDGDNDYTVVKDDNWDKTIEKYISSLDDNTVLVGIDIHE